MKMILAITLALLAAHAQALPAKPFYEHLNRVESSGMRSIAIFDLDETAVSSIRRKVHSYLRAAQDLRGTVTATQRDAVDSFYLWMKTSGEQSIRKQKNQYDSNEMYRVYGGVDPELRKKIEERMLQHYLGDGDLIMLDQVMRGAGKLIRELYSKNYWIYFVSSRYEDTQGEGTMRMLKTSGLLKQGLGQVVLRQRGEASIDFKRRAFQSIAQVAGFNHRVVSVVAENEPENMNAMTDTFPEALAIFIRGAHLKEEAIKKASVIKTNSFVLEY